MASSSSSASTRQDDDQVLVEEKSSLRMLTLNRTQQLNALSYYMVCRLLELLLAYENDPAAKLIILKGKGRAFCAGGDVTAMALDIKEDNRNWKISAQLFWKFFNLNYVMATYSKPQVCILNGIVMGAGAGYAIHGRFRIATENSLFALPETALGVFPDILVLSRLPGFFGEYVGLSGARLDGAEMLACGLATHFIPAKRLPLLEEALLKIPSADAATISATIQRYAELPKLKERSAYNRLDLINRCFSARTVEEILSALEKEATGKKDDWISATIASLKAASPTSLKISLASIRGGKLQGIEQSLVREYRIVCHVLRGDVSKDFIEGCMAVLIDKDYNPKPLRLELVSDEMVNRYLSKVDDEEWEELQLPCRPSNLSSTAIPKL